MRIKKLPIVKTNVLHTHTHTHTHSWHNNTTPFRPRKQSLGCSGAEKYFNKVPKTVSGKNLKLFQLLPPSPLRAALFAPCAFVSKCKMQRLKRIVCCTPQRLDSYLFKQSTDRCWARCGARCGARSQLSSSLCKSKTQN